MSQQFCDIWSLGDKAVFGLVTSKAARKISYAVFAVFAGVHFLLTAFLTVLEIHSIGSCLLPYLR